MAYSIFVLQIHEMTIISVPSTGLGIQSVSERSTLTGTIVMFVDFTNVDFIDKHPSDMTEWLVITNQHPTFAEVLTTSLNLTTIP